MQAVSGHRPLVWFILYVAWHAIAVMYQAAGMAGRLSYDENDPALWRVPGLLFNGTLLEPVVILGLPAVVVLGVRASVQRSTYDRALECACGYLLRGIPEDHVCPECGRPRIAADEDGTVGHRTHFDAVPLLVMGASVLSYVVVRALGWNTPSARHLVGLSVSALSGALVWAASRYAAARNSRA